MGRIYNSTETSEVLKHSLHTFLTMFSFIQPKHLKYWNKIYKKLYIVFHCVRFNRNIWSIETPAKSALAQAVNTNSTETSEVLKPR